MILDLAQLTKEHGADTALAVAYAISVLPEPLRKPAIATVLVTIATSPALGINDKIAWARNHVGCNLPAFPTEWAHKFDQALSSLLGGRLDRLAQQ